MSDRSAVEGDLLAVRRLRALTFATIEFCTGGKA